MHLELDADLVEQPAHVRDLRDDADAAHRRAGHAPRSRRPATRPCTRPTRPRRRRETTTGFVHAVDVRRDLLARRDRTAGRVDAKHDRLDRLVVLGLLEQVDERLGRDVAVDTRARSRDDAVDADDGDRVAELAEANMSRPSPKKSASGQHARRRPAGAARRRCPTVHQIHARLRRGGCGGALAAAAGGTGGVDRRLASGRRAGRGGGTCGGYCSVIVRPSGRMCTTPRRAGAGIPVILPHPRGGVNTARGPRACAPRRGPPAAPAEPGGRRARGYDRRRVRRPPRRAHARPRRCRRRQAR